MAVYENFSLCKVHDAGHGSEGRCFPGAIVPDESEYLTGFDCQIQVVHCPLSAGISL